MSNPDPFTVSFPRWIELSGLPGRLCQTIGPEAWLAFRKLVEVEVERNLIPGWAGVRYEDLATWTGLTETTLLDTLERLVEQGFIELRPIPANGIMFRIREPLTVPIEESEIRKRMTETVSAPPGMYLRYLTPLEAEGRVQQVIHLYQCCFGISFTPRIAEDLEQIAVSYDMGSILGAFEEAYRQGRKGLAWIKRHLAADRQGT